MREHKTNKEFRSHFLVYNEEFQHLTRFGVEYGKGYLPRWVHKELQKGNVVVLDTVLVDDENREYVVGARGKAYTPYYEYRYEGRYFKGADFKKYYDQIRLKFIDYPFENQIYGFGKTKKCSFGNIEFIGEHVNEDYVPDSFGTIISYETTPTMYGGDME